jgi:hypothetical protein
MVKGHGEGMYAGDALACTVFPTRSTANVHRALSTDSQTERKRVGDSIHWMRSKRNAEGEEIEIKTYIYLCADYGYIRVSKKD